MVRFNNVDASGIIYMKILINRNVGGQSRLTALMGNQVNNGPPNTLSVSAVVYLPAFTIVSVGIYVGNDGYYQIDQESSFTMLYLGETRSHFNCVNSLSLSLSFFVGRSLLCFTLSFSTLSQSKK